MENEKDYTKLNTVSLRDLGRNEYWLQDAIADNPKILGLGETVELLDKERTQPSGGRLDMLLKKDSSNERFELEIQLGTTDETHIVRTIEYWDIERRRYPGIDHVAVIVAEEISGRFFNVIGLFGNFIPLIALKVTAFQTREEKIPLHFFKILDTRNLIASVLDEENDKVADESYWVGKSGEQQLAFAKKIISEITDGQPYYTNNYIATKLDNRRIARLRVVPQRGNVVARFFFPESDEITSQFSDKEIFDSYRRGSYWFRLSSHKELENNKEILRDLFCKVTGADDLEKSV